MIGLVSSAFTSIDVTFDGFHILNGDVVSPNPNISIRMRDDNSLLFKTDTTGFNLSLRLPGEASEFQRVNFSDPRVQFVPASEGQYFEVEFFFVYSCFCTIDGYLQ